MRLPIAKNTTRLDIDLSPNSTLSARWHQRQTMPRFLLVPNLFARVILLVSTGLLLMFGGFAYLGLQAVEESTTRALQERLLVAQISASRVDDLLTEKISLAQAKISEAGIDPDQCTPSNQRNTLRAISQYLGDFVLYVAVIDSTGKIVCAEPEKEGIYTADLSDNRYLAQVHSTGKPVVSGYFAPVGLESSAAILVPTLKGDAVNGAVAVAVNLRHSSISHLLGPLGIGERGYAEIVDEDGFPLASTWEEQSWINCRYGDRFAGLIRERGTTVGRCHDCHTTSATRHRQNGVMAFAALSTAPWGIVVQQAEEEAFAYNKQLERNLLLFGTIAFFITLVVAWLLTRSVVNPIQTLTAASQRIAAGDLAQPIPRMGGGEINVLARSFDEMRAKLKQSLDAIQGWNSELERRVELRTRELANAELERIELLRKLVVAQEEERREMARELHDETSQALTALVVGLETATAAPAQTAKEMKERLAPIKSTATEMLREIQRIIHDLRPAILDDLGLVQAIDWYAENRLKSQNVQVVFETNGVETRLPSEIETVVFRIAQESINNIVKHAKAENVSISLNFAETSIALEIEDDGCGFDPAIVAQRGKSNASFGLVGIKERAALFGGTAKIESEIGEGTSILATIPLKGIHGNGHDSSDVSGRPRHLERGTESAPESV